MNELHLPSTLENSRRVLVSGAGGGFDVYAGLPIYQRLRSLGKKVFLANLSFVSLETTNAQALTHGKDNPAATAGYEKALQQLKSGDLKIDFKALRVNCAASKFECEADSDDIKLLSTLLNDKKFDQALKKVNQLLKKVFVDAELHYIALIANSESGNKEKAEFHKAVIRGLLDSIQENKHGLSEEDAFVVIVHEEYTFLRFSNMQVTKQSLSHKDGHSYDIMVCKNMSDKGREVTAYFNVDIPMQSLKDALAN